MKCMLVTRKAQGGIRTHLKTLIEKLPKYNITPIICGPGEDYEKDFREVQVLHLPLEDGVDMINDYKNVIKLKEYIRRFEPDIVHSHGYKASLVVAITNNLIKIPWIATIHNFKTYPNNKKTFELFVKKILNRANKIQVVSYSLKNELVSQGINEEKCSVLYNGISLYPFHRPYNNNLPLPKGELIGCIGRLNHDKGIDNFIYAIKYLYDRYHYFFNSRKFYFLIIGDGPLKKELQKLTWKLGLASKIIFLGHREDVYDILRFLKVLCIPSRKEGLSITALEAMAAFCPVVASRKGGLSELIKHGETGLLVPSEDSLKMGEAIMTLVKNKTFKRKITWQGYINVIDNFTDDVMVKELVNQYKDIALPLEVKV